MTEEQSDTTVLLDYTQAGDWGVRETKDDELAELFHNIYELLAPKFGYATREDTRKFDPSSQNGRLMIAVCSAIRPLLRQENEYICKCGLRVTPHRCKTGEKF